MTDDTSVQYAVVVPTVGRPSLLRLLTGLARAKGPAPVEVVVVDDRPPDVDDASLDAWSARPAPEVQSVLTTRVLRAYGHGPAAARNLGWRVTSAPWVAFLDDDVELSDSWCEELVADLRACPADVGGSQARLQVPLPSHRRPTDWERSTAALMNARWATADMAYRRETLIALGGFDERFPRAYREDADLALRAREAGWRLLVGNRSTTHPVRDVDDRVSLRVQRGNMDDALMRRLHGRDWRARAETGRGRLPWHLLTCSAATTALVALTSAVPIGAADRPRLRAAGMARTAGLAAGLWLALTADFARRRICPGPRTVAEVRRMALTSIAIPPAAVWHRLRGEVRHSRAEAWPPAVRAVLFDRDGTLVNDVPYNGDPSLIQPVQGAREAVERLRRKGIRLGVVTNQSAVGRGFLERDAVDAVNARVEEQLGPFGSWQVCPHTPDDGCGCRKPQPGMVHAAARDLGVDVRSCVVIGDIGADVCAARAAGAGSVLVPTDVTLPAEIRDAPFVAENLAAAVDLLLGART